MNESYSNMTGVVNVTEELGLPKPAFKFTLPSSFVVWLTTILMGMSVPVHILVLTALYIGRSNDFKSEYFKLAAALEVSDLLGCFVWFAVTFASYMGGYVAHNSMPIIIKIVEFFCRDWNQTTLFLLAVNRLAFIYAPVRSLHVWTSRLTLTLIGVVLSISLIKTILLTVTVEDYMWAHIWIYDAEAGLWSYVPDRPPTPGRIPARKTGVHYRMMFRKACSVQTVVSGVLVGFSYMFMYIILRKHKKKMQTNGVNSSQIDNHNQTSVESKLVWQSSLLCSFLVLEPSVLLFNGSGKAQRLVSLQLILQTGYFYMDPFLLILTSKIMRQALLSLIGCTNNQVITVPLSKGPVSKVNTIKPWVNNFLEN